MEWRLVDLRRLEVFVAVARARSFTRAAGDLHLSQSAVSQQIAALETELGAQLLDRRRRRVVLTAAGAVLEERAQRLLADSESARRAVAAADGRMTGALRIAASLTVATYLLPRPLAELTRAHPEVRIFVQVENTRHVSAALYDGHVDIGLIEGAVDIDGLLLEVLREDELVVIAPAAHRFADDQELEFAQLAAEPFITRERGSGTRQVAESALSDAGYAPAELRTIAELSGIEPIKACVEAGLGVAIVSALSIRRELAHGTLIARPVRGVTMGRQLTAAFAHGQPILPAAGELARLLRQTGLTEPGSLAVVRRPE
jgi:LysR family transcriptional regulator, transcriptional activator of the cysJI operon